MYKKRTVVMIPTKEKAHLMMHQNKLFYFYDDDTIPKNSAINQNLYIISDDNIKEGCKLTDIRTGEIHTFVRWQGTMLVTSYDTEIGPGEAWIARTLCNFKEQIIASTDTSLTIKRNIKSEYCNNSEDIECILPKPSQSFIQNYVEEYNKGNKIEDVMVEYEAISWEPKVSKNNTINIKSFKELWTKNEVKQLCWQAFIDFKCLEGKIKPSDAELLLTPFNEWVEQNL